ncbi:hypothetical protein YH65_01960 [Sulfurovum lithotrophicum]|uniref:DUF1501 domain-containing protein n=1 Tax=Sulfurovum lithotrophicum TaxID=206403 RepID=A0A7U4RQ23_9BACT|nr:DUF1501 domain-containing protein [Sulfurovum lithotrophicum]AKF24296.1 hypothetical protein YH65_01960 [Sulfurovum lithotrophicum]
MKKERRDFLRLMYNSSITAALAPMLAPQEIYASDSQTFDDYKAVVYISLFGGNDAINMILPTERSGEAGYDTYADIRKNLVVSYDDLSEGLTLNTEGKLDLSSANPYDVASNLNEDAYRKGMYHIGDTGIGVNGMMPEVAQMMNENKLAVIASVGTLVVPKFDPVSKQKLSGVFPDQLFAHDRQRRLQETGQADNPTGYGWIGRLFDNLQGINGSGIITQNISFSGHNHSLVGQHTYPLELATNPAHYQTRAAGEIPTRQQLNESLTGNPFERLYNKMIGKSYSLVDELTNIWDNARIYSTLDSYGNSLFSFPSEAQINMEEAPSVSLIKSFEAIAKMIDYGKQNGLKRQVFYIEHGGYDTHSAQLDMHPKLLRELSLGLDKFQKAMDEMGMSDKVTAFTVSDFGRSVIENGDGTDHAWAGHNLVMGGAVNGGQMYGDFPLLVEQTVDESRIIPTIAIEQQFATVLKWFGVDDTLNNTLFPNLKNFSQSDLGFMKA